MTRKIFYMILDRTVHKINGESCLAQGETASNRTAFRHQNAVQFINKIAVWPFALFGFFQRQPGGGYQHNMVRGIKLKDAVN